MACEPNTLATDARCLTCLSPDEHMWVQTYLLAQLAGGSTDPNTLAHEARCFSCINPDILQWVKTYLLCQLVEGGGGGLPDGPGTDNWSLFLDEGDPFAVVSDNGEGYEYYVVRYRIDGGAWFSTAATGIDDTVALTEATPGTLEAQARYTNISGTALSNWSAVKSIEVT